MLVSYVKELLLKKNSLIWLTFVSWYNLVASTFRNGKFAQIYMAY